MRLLRIGNRLARLGNRLVSSLCPACCGPVGQCYAKLDSCVYQVIGTCAEEQKPLTIYVARSALLELEARSPCRFINTPQAGTLYYGGRCFVGGECEYGNPSDPDYDPDVLTPIPPGSTIITDSAALSCFDDCSDVRCYEALWVPVVECEGQPNHFERPRYVCSRTLDACAMVRFPNDAGRLVCGSVNPVTAIGNPDPNGVFYIDNYGQNYNSDCCDCLSNVPEDTCTRGPAVDNTDPCYPWTGPTRCCCDDATDYWCVNNYFFEYHPLAPDIINNGHTRTGLTTCGAPGQNQVTVDIAERWSSIPQLNTDYQLTFSFACGVWPNLTDMVATAFGYFCNSICNPNCETDDPDRVMTFLQISRSCQAAFVNAIYTQYEAGSNRQTIRAIWRFQFNATKVATGNCAGGCSGQGVAVGPEQAVKIGKPAKGCSGCKQAEGIEGVRV